MISRITFRIISFLYLPLCHEIGNAGEVIPVEEVIKIIRADEATLEPTSFLCRTTCGWSYDEGVWSKTGAHWFKADVAIDSVQSMFKVVWTCSETFSIDGELVSGSSSSEAASNGELFSFWSRQGRGDAPPQNACLLYTSPSPRDRG